MKNQTFILSFFTSLLSREKIIKYRRKYHWIQLLFLFLSMTSLQCVPITLNGMETAKILVKEEFTNYFSTITAKEALELQNMDFFDRRLNETKRVVLVEQKKLKIGENMTKTDKIEETTLNFTKNNWIFSRTTPKGIISIEVPYSANFSAGLQKEDWLDFLETELLQSNLLIFLLLGTFFVGGLITVMNSLLFLGVALFMKLSQKNMVKSYKESFAIVLACFGGGALLSSFIGLFFHQIFLIVGIQSIWGVGMLLNVFYQEKKQIQKTGRKIRHA